MASRYDELENEFNVSSVELEKADITLAALLNGYMSKRAVLGRDESDVFFKMEAGRKLKTFAVPVGEKQLSETERAIVDLQLGLNGREIDDTYLLGLVESYDKDTMKLFITSTYQSLVENNRRDSVELKSYYTAKLAQILEMNNRRREVVADERE